MENTELITKHERIKDALQQKYLYVLEKYKNINQVSFIEKNATIWVCWWQGERNMPDVVRICYESICRNSGNHSVKLVTRENYTEYIQLPEYMVKKINIRQISLTHLSDILRMNLLYEYGGYWMDATILMNQPLCEEENTEFFTLRTTPDITYVANGRWTIYLMGGGRHGLLFDFAKSFLEEYWKKESALIDYFLIDYIVDLAYDHLPSVKKMIDRNDCSMPNIYDLSSILNQPFDDDRFDEIRSKAYFHKLSWKQSYITATETGEQTFFGHLYSRQRYPTLSVSENHLTLSFCITCKNRFHQISRTLWKNLEDNRSQQQQVEFVLVDFGSTDGLKEWIVNNFQEELISGYLRYYYTDELPYWHMSIAKNTAHLLARNDILVSLDCDNYTGCQGGKFVIDKFVNHRMDIVFHQFSGNLYDGTHGRISVLKKYFHSVGGYDESFEPVNFEDSDLIDRLKEKGLMYIRASNKRYNQAITNTKQEGMIYIESTKNCIEMLRENGEKSKQNIKNGCFIANAGVFGIRKNVYDHRGKLYEINQDRLSGFSQVEFPVIHFQSPHSAGSMPKIIHQVWEGRSEPLPETFAHLSESWKKHYPEWQYFYWDGKRMDNFIETYYPQFVEIYRSFSYHVQRWDAIRYLILDKIGGMYVDFDYESIAPIDELVRDKTCCFAMEPESHCRIFGKSLMFNNALMLSVPGHPFMRKVIETVFSENWQKAVTEAGIAYTDEKNRKNHVVLHSTGLWMLIELYNQLSEKEKGGIYLIPDKYVTPFDVDQARSVVRGANTEELEICLTEAYAVHYFFGLWRSIDRKKHTE